MPSYPSCRDRRKKLGCLPEQPLTRSREKWGCNIGAQNFVSGSFALDGDALAKRPELLKSVLEEVMQEFWRRGLTTLPDAKNIVGVAIHFVIYDGKM